MWACQRTKKGPVQSGLFLILWVPTYSLKMGTKSQWLRNAGLHHLLRQNLQQYSLSKVCPGFELNEIEKVEGNSAKQEVESGTFYKTGPQRKLGKQPSKASLENIFFGAKHRLTKCALYPLTLKKNHLSFIHQSLKMWEGPSSLTLSVTGIQPDCHTAW